MSLPDSEEMAECETRLTGDPADLELLAPMIAWAFGGNSSGALEWLQRAGNGAVRVANFRGSVGGGLLEIPMAQWFGGQSVPMLGIAGVAIAPEARGAGVALALVRAALQSARERGLCLSTLYPSTYGLYRKAGYELAGSYCRFSVQLREIKRARRVLGVESVEGHAPSIVEALYREVARERTGHLDRGPYVWHRVRNPEREPARGFAVEGPSGLEGYLYVKAAAPQRVPLELKLSDFVTRTPAAFQSLLAFLADHSTTAERASWHGGPSDARVLGLPDRGFKVTVEDYWMLRIVDVAGALLARGYPAVDVAIDLDVDDVFLAGNAGRYPLRVERGSARMALSKAALSARLSVGALSALYAGFVHPRELVLQGQLDADSASVAALSLLFGGPAPALCDFF